MENIVWKRADGGISITHCVDGVNADEEAKKLKEQSEVLYKNHGIKDVYYDSEIIAMNVDVPEDREFRNAWTFTGKKLKVDMKLARELHIGRIRQKRNEALTELDKETMAAISDKEELAKVEKKKQALRDSMDKIESLCDAAETVDELRAVVLDDGLKVTKKR